MSWNRHVPGLSGPRLDRTAKTTVTFLAIVVALFFVLPFVGLAQRAVENGGFWDLATHRQTREALWLSLWTSTTTATLAAVFGTPLAYALSRSRFPGKVVVDGLVDLPIVLPPTVAGVALLTAFGRRGLLGEPIDNLTGYTFGFSTTAVIMAQMLVSAPFFFRAARSGFDAIDPQIERVAYTLGASRTRTFLRITLPQAWPALLAGIVLCWARSMGELGATLIFAGNLEGKTQTMPLAIIEAFSGSALGLDGAIVLSLILLGVALAVLTLFRAVAARGLRQP